MLHTTVSGSPGASRVVLVHGFTQTGASWSPVVERIGSDFETMAVDLPGHGRSGPPTDLWAAADALVETGGRAAYVGYSLGGRVALHAALSHPGEVARLVLLGATGGLDSAEERAERRRTDGELADEIERDGVDRFLAAWLAQPLFGSLPADAAGLADRRSNTASGLAGSLRLAGTGTIDPPLWDRMAGLDMPVLVMAGEHDTKFTALAQRLVGAIGRNAQLALVPGAGHAAHLEQPDHFTELVNAFLSPKPQARS